MDAKVGLEPVGQAGPNGDAHVPRRNRLARPDENDGLASHVAKFLRPHARPFLAFGEEPGVDRCGGDTDGTKEELLDQRCEDQNFHVVEDTNLPGLGVALAVVARPT